MVNKSVDGIVHRSKKTAEKARKRMKDDGAGKTSTWRGPAITNKPGWYVVSRIRGKRS